MKPSHVLIAAAALLVLAPLAAPLWVGNPEGVRRLAEELWHAEELGRHCDRAYRVAAAKRAVADEVVAGRLTLREAAEQFRQLDGDIPPRAYEGVASEEALCLNVVAHAGYVSRDDPGRDRSRDPALDRLRQEYLRLFGRDPGGFLLCERPRPAGSAE